MENSPHLAVTRIVTEEDVYRGELPQTLVSLVLSVILHIFLLIAAFWLSSTEPERNILFVHFRQKIFRNEPYNATQMAQARQQTASIPAAGAGTMPFIPMKELTVKVPVGSSQAVHALREVKGRISGLWEKEDPPAGGRVLARLLIAPGGQVVSVEVELISGPPDLGVHVADLLRRLGSFDAVMESATAPLTVECDFTVTVRGQTQPVSAR